MRTVFISWFMVMFISVYGQEFRLLRQNDNLKALDTLREKNIYEKVKQIDIGANAKLSFGGSWRAQAESFINQNFQNSPDQDNLWFLNRFLLHTHLKIQNKFELFAEMNSSLIYDKIKITPVDKDELSVNQLFVNYHVSQKLSFILGRQNLKLGSGRLVDIREGPNVRKAFDLAEIDYQSDRFEGKAFFSIPVKQGPYVFDNKYLNFDETFSALYTTISLNKYNNWDMYMLYRKHDNVIYNNAQGNERRTSIGLRYFGNYKTLTFNNEAVYQFGEIENRNILAWTLSMQLENQTKLGNHSYNMGVKSEIISGDKNRDDNNLNTFDALYPIGSYFGRVARFGPSNLIDLHPYINTQFNKLFIELDFDTFWRYSINDGVYSASLLLQYPSTNSERYIARQLGTIVGYEIDKHINFELQGNIIFPGSFLRLNNKGNTLYYAKFTTEILF